MTQTKNKLAILIELATDDVTYHGKADTVNVTDLKIDLNLE